MNKSSALVFLLLFVLISGDAYSQSKGKPNRDTSYIEDSVVYYEIEIEGRQRNYKDLLVGTWTIDNMRRQAKALPDVLNNIEINFDTDSTFSVGTGCGRLVGIYRLKGTSVKFMNVNLTNTTCEFTEQEAALQKLLSQTVSAYTVESNILLLRDGSSNVIFRASRKKN
jgi:heat shock protein HslJ